MGACAAFPQPFKMHPKPSPYGWAKEFPELFEGMDDCVFKDYPLRVGDKSYKANLLKLQGSLGRQKSLQRQRTKWPILKRMSRSTVSLRRICGWWMQSC
jgi:hypothetical protein